MFNFFTPFIAMMSGLSSALPPLAGVWTQLANAPSSYQKLTSVTYKDKAYMVIGASRLVYDPATDTWDTSLPSVSGMYKEAAPMGRVGAMAFIGPGRANGVTGNPPTFRWNLDTHTVTDMANPIPVYPGRNEPGSAQLGDHLYTMCGYQGAYLASCLRYDMVLNTWEELADHPVAHSQGTGLSAGGVVYNGLGNQCRGKLYRYDHILDVWSSTPIESGIANFTGGCSGCERNGKGYYLASTGPVYEVDPTTDTINLGITAHPNPRQSSTWEVLEGAIYSFTGYANNTVYKLT